MTLNSIIYCFLMIVFFESCNENKQSGSLDLLHDSTINSQNDAIENLNNEYDQQDEGVVLAFTEQYINPTILDSIFIIEQNVVRIKLRHFCLMDSAFFLPKNYSEIFSINEFIVHNFSSSVEVIKNNDLILDTIIQKSDFNAIIKDEYVKKYGVLLYPNLRRNGSFIEIGYSISIPLTDIGIGVTVSIDQNGNIKIIN